MKIGIVIGSVRDKRVGEKVGAWVHEQASSRSGAQYELIDLKKFGVPLLTSGTHPMAAKRTYESENTTAWSRAIDACDGFVFVTPEYNHGVPGAFKNAVDVLGPEWMDKTVGFVGYGSVGGVRAVESWRTIVVNFRMHCVRAEVNLLSFFDLVDGGLTLLERRPAELTALLDQLEALTALVRPAQPA